MPPPKRKKGEPSASGSRAGGTRAMTSVYPPESVGPPLGGYWTTPFAQAIQCFAALISDAAKAVEAEFSRQEWELIYLAVKEREVEPQDDSPGKTISQSLGRLADRGNVGVEGDIPGLRRRVAALDYVHAWAVLIAVGVRKDWHSGKRKTKRPPMEWDKEQWWTLAFRWQWCQREGREDEE